MERVNGIEPSLSGWEPGFLPLEDTRAGEPSTTRPCALPVGSHCRPTTGLKNERIR
jgi:hypothetical protein